MTLKLILLISLVIQLLSAQPDLVTYLPGFGVPLEKQFAGHITVNPTHGGELFYWFFEKYPSTQQVENVPVIMWLNGGPGCSSMTGLFGELGPYTWNPSNTSELIRNPYSWSSVAHLIFIDNPVGVGLSYVENEEGYTKNQDQVAEQMYIFLSKFFELHPEYKSLDFYVAGESYAGKYVPSIAHYIQEKGGINLKGILCGNGLIHPLIQRLTKLDQLYWSGMLGYEHRQIGRVLESRCIRHIQQGYSNEREGPCTDIEMIFKVSSGPQFNLYDIRKYEETYPKGPQETYLNRDDVIRALNLKKTKKFVSCDDKVYYYLRNDILLSTRHLIKKLMDAKIRVLLFAGNFDTKDAPFGIEQFLRQMNLEGFNDAKRKLWRVDNKTAGFEISIPYLTFLTIHGAGHYVPKDQPKHSLDMVNRFINQLPFCKPGDPVPYLEENPVQYLADNDKVVPKKPINNVTCDGVEDYICQNLLNCTNGNCINGKCVCKEGFVGYDCESKISKLEIQNPMILQQQEWRYFNLNIENDESLSFSLIQKNQSTLNENFIIGNGIGGIFPKEGICMYGQRDELPNFTEFTFVHCNFDELEMTFSKGNWYIGIFNSHHDTIELSLNLNVQPSTFIWFIVPIVVLSLFVVVLLCIVILLLRKLKMAKTDYSRVVEEQ